MIDADIRPSEDEVLEALSPLEKGLSKLRSLKVMVPGLPASPRRRRMVAAVNEAARLMRGEATRYV